VAEMLEVFERAAHHYLNKITEEGVIIQIGETGKNAEYKTPGGFFGTATQ